MFIYNILKCCFKHYIFIIFLLCIFWYLNFCILSYTFSLSLCFATLYFYISLFLHFSIFIFSLLCINWEIEYEKHRSFHCLASGWSSSKHMVLSKGICRLAWFLNFFRFWPEYIWWTTTLGCNRIIKLKRKLSARSELHWT